MLLKIALLLLVTLQWNAIDCLDCYSCSNVSHVGNCQSVISCPSDHICHATIYSGLFTLGCKDSKLCHTVHATNDNSTGGGASIIGRSGSTGVVGSCSECCKTGMCNRQLCQGNDPSCHDSGHVDCAATGSFLNLCAEKARAKAECRRFCGLCRMVDGGWTVWSTWSACSYSCDNGTTTRTRTCSDPAPANGGDYCTGARHETNTCTNDKCPVDGGWTVWSTWSACSTSCDNGTTTRTRTCSDPAPANGGDYCTGARHETNTCTNDKCPVNGAWSSWSGWGSCSVTCGIGLQRRDRSCSSPYPSNSGLPCFGDVRDDRVCLPGACHDGGWSSWDQWGTCSKTCDVGTRKRSRSCTNPVPSILGRFCAGDNMQVETCSLKSCVDTNIGFVVNTPQDVGLNSIRFSHIVTNYGGGYNTSTGVFTCSVAGMYAFSLYFLRSSGIRTAYCSIYKGKLALGEARVASTNVEYIPASVTVNVHLQPGDTVYLKGCTKASTIMPGSTYSTFTGFLVNAD